MRQRAARFPDSPGVYVMRDRDGEVLYVGKARSLRRRVASYLRTSQPDPRIASLVENAADISCTVTDSEEEALLLESNLIKQHLPRYNIRLVDDKRYPLVKFTNERFPRMLLVRRRRNDGAVYVGPFSSAGRLRAAMEAASRLFPLRRCTQRRTADRPCLNYHIGRCGCPRFGRIAPEEYASRVRGAVLFMSGKYAQLTQQLRQEMKRAAGDRAFERAALLRDRIAAVEGLAVEQKVFSPRSEDFDVAAAARSGERAHGVVFCVREGKLVARRDLPLRLPSGAAPAVSPGELQRALLLLYCADADSIPPLVLTQSEPADARALHAWLAERRGAPVSLRTPARGDKRKLAELARRNAELALETDRPRTAAPAAVEQLREDLRLASPPRVIECFDVANLRNTAAVAAMVRFENGRPRRSDYRRFRIRSVAGPDDPAMIAEAVGRRYQRLVSERFPLPDLVMVDGGHPQVGSAREALDALGLQRVPVIGLAKKEETLYLASGQEVRLAGDRPSRLLLQRIRDEAHRFAATYHRKVRGKSMTRSSLDAVPGVGPTRRHMLLARFGSTAGILSAGKEALCEVRGITPRLARDILRILQNR